MVWIYRCLMLLLNYNILGTFSIVDMFKEISGLKFIIKWQSSYFCDRYWFELIHGLCSLPYFALACVNYFFLLCSAAGYMVDAFFLDCSFWGWSLGNREQIGWPCCFPGVTKSINAFIIVWFCAINRIFPISRHYNTYRKMTIAFVIFNEIG